MRKIEVLLALLVFFSLETQAQKIKYKDLFFLLETGKYDDGEPLLKKFLKEDKNADHANANLQMAFIFNKKVDDGDVLLKSDELITNADTALIYYGLALKYIDEKEIKKNDEYYQAYQRRDIRTGKFGIKLADVQFDLEKRISSLKDKKVKVQELQVYYQSTLSNYNEALEGFKQIRKDFPTQKILYLRSNEDLLVRIGEVENKSKLALQNFDSFQATLKKIEKAGYAPALHMRDIIDYEKDGLTNIDLTSDNIKFWDYEKWGESVNDAIKNNITPLRSELVAYDQSLNQLLDRLETDSMSMADKIKPSSAIVSKLREYDSDPLPEAIFNLKKAEIMMKSLEMDHLNSRDSADVIYQLNYTNTKLGYVSNMDSLISLLIARNQAEDELNYANFINNEFKSAAGLQVYIKSKLDKVQEEKRNTELQFEKLAERSKWLIDDQDSIPIFKEVDLAQTKYVPLLINNQLTAGLYFSGKTPAKGYFAAINNKRVPTLKVIFEVDTENFKKQNLETIKTLISADDDGHVFYLMFYSQMPEKEEFAASVCKIYSSDGLAWEKDITLATAPKEMVINGNTGDLIIDYDKANYLGTQPIADRLVLDKKGQIKK
ncbi:MAG TPA: hypothetical protein PKL31_11310 [Fulvivirga sp.]|nr:hypothetical protein [Fulvivirga sp.]